VIRPRNSAGADNADSCSLMFSVVASFGKKAGGDADGKLTSHTMVLMCAPAWTLVRSSEPMLSSSRMPLSAVGISIETAGGIQAHRFAMVTRERVVGGAVCE